ncbi:MAG: hypothetical protein VW378_05810 [bacterium]
MLHNCTIGPDLYTLNGSVSLALLPDRSMSLEAGTQHEVQTYRLNNFGQAGPHSHNNEALPPGNSVWGLQNNGTCEVEQDGSYETSSNLVDQIPFCYKLQRSKPLFTSTKYYSAVVVCPPPLSESCRMIGLTFCPTSNTCVSPCPPAQDPENQDASPNDQEEVEEIVTPDFAKACNIPDKDPRVCKIVGSNKSVEITFYPKTNEAEVSFYNASDEILVSEFRPCYQHCTWNPITPTLDEFQGRSAPHPNWTIAAPENNAHCVVTVTRTNFGLAIDEVADRTTTFSQSVTLNCTDHRVPPSPPAPPAPPVPPAPPAPTRAQRSSAPDDLVVILKKPEKNYPMYRVIFGGLIGLLAILYITECFAQEERQPQPHPQLQP